MENKDYHQRLKELKLYSLERRRERYMIIYAWEMLEERRENLLNLRSRKIGRSRRIIQHKIPWSINGRKIKQAD